MGYLTIHRDCKRENTGDITRKLSRVIFRILLDNSNNCCMRRSQFSAVVVLPDWYTFRYSRAILIFAILLCRNIFLKTKLFFQSGPHPASGVSSVFLSEKENKEALSELCQAFEFAHA